MGLFCFDVSQSDRYWIVQIEYHLFFVHDIRHTPQITKLVSFSLLVPYKPRKTQISAFISRPFLYTKSVHCFPLKNLLRKSDVLIFEHQFRHEVAGLESKFFWLPLVQQISIMPSTSLCNLSDKEPRYQHLRERFLLCNLLDTFSIVKLIPLYITLLLQFVIPKSEQSLTWMELGLASDIRFFM
mgnify:CR=1 FL=1